MVIRRRKDFQILSYVKSGQIYLFETDNSFWLKILQEKIIRRLFYYPWSQTPTIDPYMVKA